MSLSERRTKDRNLLIVLALCNRRVDTDSEFLIVVLCSHSHNHWDAYCGFALLQ
ncbi:unnamed protein product [Sphenostylis stenocarpa]|uniref:Uncharacterized protein n=1 Tax=Sphenostylis stenocarpa TaxID=92480 RepID=A0AA86VUB2_9FABA|nr:unnamed protein product [Sphenostylis stenocarpa]